MEYVRIGSAGLKVSRLCLGTMTYGTPQWRPWVLDEAASRPFIARALEHGINFDVEKPEMPIEFAIDENGQNRPFAAIGA